MKLFVMKFEIMIQNKKYLSWSGILFFAFALFACNDDTEEVYVGDMKEYQKAYITTGLSYPNGSVINYTLFNGNLQLQDDKAVFVDDSRLEPQDNFNFYSEIYFRTTYPVKTQVSGTLAPRIDAEEFVEQYNVEQGLEEGVAYSLLPSGWYTLEKNRDTIAVGKKEAVIRFVPNVDAQWEYGKYLLPLTLTLDPGSSVTSSENMSDLLLEFNVKKPSDMFYEGSRFLTPEDYTVSSVTDNPKTQDDDSLFKNGFDQNPKTVWVYPSAKNSVVEIKFNKPQYLSHISVVGSSGTYVYMYLYNEGKSGNNYKQKSYNSPKGTDGSNGMISVSVEEKFTKDSKFDPALKVEKVRIGNYKSSITDVYFLVHD